MSTACFPELMYITDRPPTVMERGSGSWLFDESGRRHLDLVQGWAVNCLGHAPAVVAEALAAQAAKLLTPSPAWFNRPAIDLARRLCAATGFDRVFFASTGAEANEGAIKLARKYGAVARGGAWRIITLTGAFHGRTLATMSASGKPGWDALFAPKVPGFDRVPAGDLDALAAAVGDDTVAVLLEPVQGEAGALPMPVEFLRGVRRLCDERGLLLILDEVQTGVGRCGRFLDAENAGIRADITTLGKGLGGGVPISAVLARAEVCHFAAGDQGGTYNGNPLVCAAAGAVVDRILADGFLAEVRWKAAILRQGLQAIAECHGCAGVRGRGLLLALDLGHDGAVAVAARAAERGLLINAPRPHLIRLMPALTISGDEITLALDLLEGALA